MAFQNHTLAGALKREGRSTASGSRRERIPKAIIEKKL
jgi:hypothetical protein